MIQEQEVFRQREVPLKHPQLFHLFAPNEVGGLLRWSST